MFTSLTANCLLHLLNHSRNRRGHLLSAVFLSACFVIGMNGIAAWADEWYREIAMSATPPWDDQGEGVF